MTGSVSIGLSSDPANQNVYFDAGWLTSLAIQFLSADEKDELVKLAQPIDIMRKVITTDENGELALKDMDVSALKSGTLDASTLTIEGD